MPKEKLAIFIDRRAQNAAKSLQEMGWCVVRLTKARIAKGAKQALEYALKKAV